MSKKILFLWSKFILDVLFSDDEWIDLRWECLPWRIGDNLQVCSSFVHLFFSFHISFIRSHNLGLQKTAVVKNIDPSKILDYQTRIFELDRQNISAKGV